MPKLGNSKGVTAMVDAVVNNEATLARLKEEFREAQAPAGHFNLPPLLEQRRIEANIPDGFFEYQLAFDRVLIFQLSQTQGDKYEGTSLFMPETVKRQKERTAPKGVLCGAGLRAMDNLKSNGIELGHVVTFIHNAPWSMDLGSVSGREYSGIVMRDGDINSSEDLATSLREGKGKIVVVTYEKDGVEIREHHYQDEEGSVWAPGEPFTNESF